MIQIYIYIDTNNIDSSYGTIKISDVANSQVKCWWAFVDLGASRFSEFPTPSVETYTDKY